MFQIVGETEADVKIGRMSISSPTARALIGKKVGDSVEVNTPGGGKSYEILKVEYSLTRRRPQRHVSTRAALGALFVGAPVAALAGAPLRPRPAARRRWSTSRRCAAAATTPPPILPKRCPAYLRQYVGPGQRCGCASTASLMGRRAARPGGARRRRRHRGRRLAVDGREAPAHLLVAEPVSLPDVGGYAARRRQDSSPAASPNGCPDRWGFDAEPCARSSSVPAGSAMRSTPRRRRGARRALRHARVAPRHLFGAPLAVGPGRPAGRRALLRAAARHRHRQRPRHRALRPRLEARRAPCSRRSCRTRAGRAARWT